MLSNVDTDYFETIRDLFENGTFCDLKIVTTADTKNNKNHNEVNKGDPIFCHSLVLCAALPEFKSCILSSHPPHEEYRTLIFDGYDKDSIQLAIDGIYTELVNYSGKPTKEPWLKSFGLLPDNNSEQCSIKDSSDILQSQTFSIFSGESLIKPVFLSPVHEQLMTSVHDDYENTYQSNYDLLDSKTRVWTDSKYMDKNLSPSDIKEDSTHVLCKKPKKTEKLRKVRLKEKRDKKYSETEKVCFGCLKTFAYSTSKERKIYLKHTLSHCKCECDTNFKSKVEFEKHMRAVHKGHLYKCDYKNCNGKSTLLKEYIRHRQKHVQSNKEESNICPVCGREFINSYYMKAHYGSRHKKMKCKLCGIFTYGTDDNQKHHNAVHKPNLVCELCGNNFKTKSTLRCHVINVHTPEDQRPYKCDFCPKGFLNSRYLLTHVERDHKGNRAFTCRAIGCDRTFTLPEVRKRHEKRDHKLNINLKPGVTSKFEVHGSTLDIPRALPCANSTSTTKIINDASL